MSFASGSQLIKAADEANVPSNQVEQNQTEQQNNDTSTEVKEPTKKPVKKPAKKPVKKHKKAKKVRRHKTRYQPYADPTDMRKRWKETMVGLGENHFRVLFLNFSKK